MSNQNQFKNQINQNSFFGQFLYNQIIPEDHFLRKLSRIINFSFINELCSDLYQNQKYGQKAYLPEFLFKILFLSFYLFFIISQTEKLRNRLMIELASNGF